MKRRSDAEIGRRSRRGGLLPPLFLLFALPWACLAQPASTSDREALLAKGRELLKSGHFGQALAPLAQFKEAFPQDARGWYYSGLALAADRRWREAAVDLSAAVERDPKNLEYRLFAASALAEIEQLESALTILAPYDGEQIDHQSEPRLLWTLADLHYRRQQYGEALRALRRYEQVEPDDPRGHVRIGRIHLLESRFEEAAKAFQAALGEAPKSAAAFQGLGLAQSRMGQAEAARKSLEAAVELEPENAAYLLDLGRLLLSQGTASEAVNALERATAAPSPPPAAYYELSRAYRRAGQAGKAKETLAEFQRLDRSRQQARVTGRRVDGLLKTGQDRLGEGKISEAREAFAEAVSQDPDNWLAHSFLAKIYLSSNLPDRAAPHLFAMDKIDPDSVEGNYLLATYWYRTGDLTKALTHAEKARQRRPDYAELRNLLGNIYFSLGRREEAVKEYEAAVKLEPDRVEFQKNYATAKGQ